jgi:hypothetical protein
MLRNQKLDARQSPATHAIRNSLDGGAPSMDARCLLTWHSDDRSVEPSLRLAHQPRQPPTLAPIVAATAYRRDSPSEGKSARSTAIRKIGITAKTRSTKDLREMQAIFLFYHPLGHGDFDSREAENPLAAAGRIASFFSRRTMSP